MALFTSYLMPIAMGLISNEPLQPGVWHMGAFWGRTVRILAAVFLSLEIFVSALPTALPVVLSVMNASVMSYLLLHFLILVTWFFPWIGGRHYYHGPRGDNVGPVKFVPQGNMLSENSSGAIGEQQSSILRNLLAGGASRLGLLSKPSATSSRSKLSRTRSQSQSDILRFGNLAKYRSSPVPEDDVRQSPTLDVRASTQSRLDMHASWTSKAVGTGIILGRKVASEKSMRGVRDSVSSGLRVRMRDEVVTPIPSKGEAAARARKERQFFNDRVASPVLPTYLEAYPDDRKGG